ncbi:MAG TPA: DUF4143 domain-containing protein [Clostridiaceae bacterium]|nr:DUF4143 domain-containing protein [Clostridiaceae bacterium]
MNSCIHLITLPFCDVGLAAYLCSLRTTEAFDLSPLKGNLFESWVISEIYKSHQHNGVDPQLYYYRDSNQKEIDLLIERDGKLIDLISIPSLFAQYYLQVGEKFTER